MFLKNIVTRADLYSLTTLKCLRMGVLNPLIIIVNVWDLPQVSCYPDVSLNISMEQC